MTRFIANNVWKAVAPQAERARRRRAAIAYVTRDLPLKLQSGDILITDASKKAIASGQTNASILRALLERGVELYSRAGLHAKVVVLDGIAVASSANLSDHSVNDVLLEAGIITDHPGTVAGALSFIEQLRGLSQKLTLHGIEQLEKIPVVREGSARGHSSKRDRPRVSSESSCWITGVYELVAPFSESDQAEYDEGVEEATDLAPNPGDDIFGVRYGTKLPFFRQVREGHTVIRIWRNRSNSPRPELVYPPTSVLLRKEGRRYGWVFYANSSKDQDRCLKWSEFKRLCKRIGLPYLLSKNMNRRLPEEYSDALHDLWSKANGK